MENDESLPYKNKSDKNLHQGVDRDEIDIMEYYPFMARLSFKFFYLYLKGKKGDELLIEEEIKNYTILEGRKIYLNLQSGDKKRFDSKSLEKFKNIFIDEYHEFLLVLKSDHKKLGIIYETYNEIKREKLTGMIHHMVIESKKLEKNVSDLFTYIEKVYVSETLYLDTGPDQAYGKNFHIIIATLSKVKMDMELFLDGDEYRSCKDDFLADFNDNYGTYGTFIDKMHQKENKQSLQITKIKIFFDSLATNKMDWILEEDQIKYYPYIYDILIYKYRLFAILKTYDIQKRKSSDIEELIWNDKLHTLGNRKEYVFFFEHIRRIGDINGHIIKLFLDEEGAEEDQKFIKILLNITHRYPYPLGEKVVLPFPWIEMFEKSAPIDAYKIFYSPLNPLKSNIGDIPISSIWKL